MGHPARGKHLHREVPDRYCRNIVLESHGAEARWKRGSQNSISLWACVCTVVRSQEDLRICWDMLVLIKIETLFRREVWGLLVRIHEVEHHMCLERPPRNDGLLLHRQVCPMTLNECADSRSNRCFKIVHPSVVTFYARPSDGRSEMLSYPRIAWFTVRGPVTIRGVGAVFVYCKGRLVLKQAHDPFAEHVLLAQL